MQPPSRTQRALQVVTDLRDRMEGIFKKVRGLAIANALGALVLWALLFQPFDFSSGITLGLAILLGLAMLIPAGILGLYYLGLATAIQLPHRIAEKAGTGKQHLTRAADLIPRPRLSKLINVLWDLRGVLLESKDMLLEYTILIRLFNPFVLVLVTGAVVIGAGIILCAGIWLVLLFLY